MNNPIFIKSVPLFDALFTVRGQPVSLATVLNTAAWKEFEQSDPEAHARLKDDDAAESILEVACQNPGSVTPEDYSLVLKIYDPGG